MNTILKIQTCDFFLWSDEDDVKGCDITARTSIGNISTNSELIQPFPRSVYAEIDENSRNEVPMDVRGVLRNLFKATWTPIAMPYFGNKGSSVWCMLWNR